MKSIVDGTLPIGLFVPTLKSARHGFTVELRRKIDDGRRPARKRRARARRKIVRGDGAHRFELEVRMCFNASGQ